MARLTLYSALGLLVAASALAQPEESELTLPPEISSEPGEVSFEPPPADRENLVEAVVTSGQTDWRLPDLGSAMREEQDARDPNERIDVSFLYLYDPENEDPTEELFPDDSNPRTVGFIRVFELRFGTRSEEPE
jgi:hypothetical protein